jgi:hypothetical protein
MTAELRISSSPFFTSSVSSCTPMWVWVYSRVWWGPFFYPAWWIQLSSGWSTFGCLAVDFPGLKVGKIYLYTSLLTIWMALLVNRDTEYDYFWVRPFDWNLFSLAFLLTQLGFIKQFHLWNVCISVPVLYLTTVGNKTIKFKIIVTLWTLEAKCK